MTTTKKLTDILTPSAHQRIINRLKTELNPATPILNDHVLQKIDCHTGEYVRKTGKTPQ